MMIIHQKIAIKRAQNRIPAEQGIVKEKSRSIHPFVKQLAAFSRMEKDFELYHLGSTTKSPVKEQPFSFTPARSSLHPK